MPDWDISFLHSGHRYRQRVTAPSEAAALPKAVFVSGAVPREKVGLVVHINKTRRTYTAKQIKEEPAKQSEPDRLPELPLPYPRAVCSPDTHAGPVWPARNFNQMR